MSHHIWMSVSCPANETLSFICREVCMYACCICETWHTHSYVTSHNWGTAVNPGRYESCLAEYKFVRELWVMSHHIWMSVSCLTPETLPLIRKNMSHVSPNISLCVNCEPCLIWMSVSCLTTETLPLIRKCRSHVSPNISWCVSCESCLTTYECVCHVSQLRHCRESGKIWVMSRLI